MSNIPVKYPPPPGKDLTYTRSIHKTGLNNRVCGRLRYGPRQSALQIIFKRKLNQLFADISGDQEIKLYLHTFLARLYTCHAIWCHGKPSTCFFSPRSGVANEVKRSRYDRKSRRDLIASEHGRVFKVTHQVGPNLPLTWKQKLFFNIKSLCWNATSVLMSTGGLVLPDVSPCI